MLSLLISCKCPGIGLASSHHSLIHVSSAAHLRLNPFYSLSNFLCKTTSVSSLRFRSCKPLPFVLCIRSKLLGWLSHSQQSPHPRPLTNVSPLPFCCRIHHYFSLPGLYSWVFPSPTQPKVSYSSSKSSQPPKSN